MVVVVYLGARSGPTCISASRLSTSVTAATPAVGLLARRRQCLQAKAWLVLYLYRGLWGSEANSWDKGYSIFDFLTGRLAYEPTRAASLTLNPLYVYSHSTGVEGM